MTNYTKLIPLLSRIMENDPIRNKVEIRPLDDSDRGDVYTLQEKCRYPGVFDLSKEYFGAFVNGTLVGFIKYDAYGKEAGLIRNLLVDRDCRKLGIGTKLINAAETEIKSKGKKSWLHVRTTNEDAISLYSSLGYTIEDLLEKYYKKNPGDAFVMEKKL